MRNEIPLRILVDIADRTTGIWDPYYYRGLKSKVKLSDFVIVKKVKTNRVDVGGMKFKPINYTDIPAGSPLIFNLTKIESNHEVSKGVITIVGEQTLLFGTMRAYLANIIVTPKAEWIGMTSPIFFPIKSEFAEIVPKDDLVYFWWAYFHKQEFLDSLPKGHGGTRPRVKPEAIESIPVSIPSSDIRRNIHTRLSKIAEHDWRNYKERIEILDLL